MNFTPEHTDFEYRLRTQADVSRNRFITDFNNLQVSDKQRLGCQQLCSRSDLVSGKNDSYPKNLSAPDQSLCPVRPLSSPQGRVVKLAQAEHLLERQSHPLRHRSRTGSHYHSSLIPFVVRLVTSTIGASIRAVSRVGRAIIGWSK